VEAKKQLNVESINTNKKLGLKRQIVNFRNIDNLPKGQPESSYCLLHISIFFTLN